MIEFLTLALAGFWLTHTHVRLVSKFKIKLPVKQWEFCYHCIGFWYSLLVYLVSPLPLTLALAACTVAFVLHQLYERYKA